MASKKSIGASVEPELKRKIQRYALDQSEPGDKVTESQVVREAVQNYLAKQIEGVA